MVAESSESHAMWMMIGSKRNQIDDVFSIAWTAFTLANVTLLCDANNVLNSFFLWLFASNRTVRPEQDEVVQ